MRSTLLLATVAGAVSGATAQPVIYGIGDIPGGAVYSEVLGLSADGTVAVGRSEYYPWQHWDCTYPPVDTAVRWSRRDGLECLWPEPDESAAHAASMDGRVVVGGWGKPFRWANGDVVFVGAGGRANACSDDAMAIAGALEGWAFDFTYKCGGYFLAHQQAFRWTPQGGTVKLGHLAKWPFGWSTVAAVSADGSVLVGASRPVEPNMWYGEADLPIGPYEAFRWTAGDGMVEIAGGADVLPRLALGVSGNGRVVVGTAAVPKGNEAYRWEAGSGLIRLGNLETKYGPASVATGVSDAGDVVVGYSSSLKHSRTAIIWTPNLGMQDLREYLVSRGTLGIGDWSILMQANAVSADGRTIGGSGGQGFVAYLENTHRASLSQAEAPANADSGGGSITGNGQLIAFQSGATNLVPGDSNGKTDIFVRNRAAGWTSRESVGPGGVQANGPSGAARITPDGRWVVFTSSASNLVAGDTNAKPDIFVRDRQTATIERVSVSSAGAQANGGSDLAQITPDGHYIVFQSSATNLVASDTNGVSDIFIRDRQSGQTLRLSVNNAGEQGNGASFGPSISASGLAVAFASDSDNLAPGGDHNSGRDVFVHDRQLGMTNLVSRDKDAQQFWAPSQSARIAGNGRYVVFTTGYENSAKTVYIRDRVASTSTRIDLDAKGDPVSAVSVGIAISSDGRFVLLTSSSDKLARGDSNGLTDTFIHDRSTGHTRRVSLGVACTPATEPAYGGSMSPDGRWITFNTTSPGLVDGDQTQFNDVFVRELWEP
jgi:probable HAF family extracellular repeat protein